jgi:hypothetical protein
VAEPRPEEESPLVAVTVEEPKKECTPRSDFHEEATRSQIRTLHGNLHPVEKPLRHASIRTRLSPSRDLVHVRVRTGRAIL